MNAPRLPIAVALLLGCLLFAAPLYAMTYVVTVAGLGGTPSYVQRFTADAQALNQLFQQAGPSTRVYTLTGANATGARLTQALQQVAAAAKPGDDFILILIGHGTDDGITYKFNLIGPDISAVELARLCGRIPARRQLIVDTSSASGGAVAALERPGRALITATKDGREKNATVFARYFVQALQDPAADLNKDQAISGLEAFEYASRKVADFYKSQKRLATEHALKNDDRLLGQITLVRFGQAQREYADPAAHVLILRKESLERQIDALNYRKDALSDNDYKDQITMLLLQLAAVQKKLDQMEQNQPAQAPTTRAIAPSPPAESVR